MGIVQYKLEYPSPVDRAPDISASQQIQRITRVHSQRPILRLRPLPLARLVVPDLQRSDGLDGARWLSGRIRLRPAQPSFAA